MSGQLLVCDLPQSSSVKQGALVCATANASSRYDVADFEERPVRLRISLPSRISPSTIAASPCGPYGVYACKRTTWLARVSITKVWVKRIVLPPGSTCAVAVSTAAVWPSSAAKK